jgi:hypothetical protein
VDFSCTADSETNSSGLNFSEGCALQTYLADLSDEDTELTAEGAVSLEFRWDCSTLEDRGQFGNNT